MVQADAFVIHRRLTVRRAALWTAGFGVVYLLVQMFGYALRTGTGVRLVSVIWPAAGLLPAVLTITDRRLWPALLVVAALAEVGVGVLIDGTDFSGGRGLAVTTVMAANLISGVSLALAMRLFVGGPDPLSSGRCFLRYGLACAVAVAAGAIIATPVLAANRPDPFAFDQFRTFWLSGLSGCLLVTTPILVTAATRPTWPTTGRWLEAAGLALVTALLAVGLSTAPAGVSRVGDFGELMLLPLLAWAMIRFGSAMLTALTSTIVLVVVISMVNGRGTLVVDGLSLEENVLSAQGHIVPGMLAMLGVAAVYEGRRAADRRLRATEQQLRSVEKMNALATMASGVAHDFGNLAIAVRAASSAVHRGLGQPDPPVRRALHQLEAAASQADLLTQSLETVGIHRLTEVPEPVDVGHAVAGVGDVFAPLLDRQRQFTTRAPAETVVALAQAGDVQQIVSNLIVNARDATKPGGRIDVRVGRTRDTAFIEVADDGTGMAPDVRERMFDPFFTTKPRGKGTGLGLATISSLVHDRRGRIDVESALGRGTTITVHLPLAHASTADAAAVSPPAPETASEPSSHAEPTP